MMTFEKNVQETISTWLYSHNTLALFFLFSSYGRTFAGVLCGLRYSPTHNAAITNDRNPLSAMLIRNVVFHIQEKP